MTDERVERIEKAIDTVIRDQPYEAAPGELVTRMAEAVVSALDAESLEAVLRNAGWIAYMDVVWNEDDGYSAEVSGYVSEDGNRIGEGSGPTIDAAIRNAVANAAKVGS